MTSRLAASLLVLLLCPPVARADDWRFLYEQDGLNVYSDMGSPRSFKAEGTLELNIIEMLAVLADVPRRVEWIKNLAETRVIDGDPAEHVLIYSRYDLPWPATDRDSVIESFVTKDLARGRVAITFRAVADARVPPVDGVIRVPTADGDISLESTAAHRVLVRYTAKTDPGGWLPEWINNIFTRDVPLKTIKALAAQVARTRGQYEDFMERTGQSP